MDKTLFKIRLLQTWKKFSKTFTFIKEPSKYIGEGSIKNINHILLDRRYQVHNVLIVTGPEISQTELLQPIYDNLKRNGINYSVYSGVKVEPTVDQVEEGVSIYQQKKCEAIVAFGGGSVIDVAKCIGARVKNPMKPLKKIVGMMKVKNKLPLLVAIPTTAGTGSDASFTAELNDLKTNYKYKIVDPKLMPKFAILDSNLTVDLPKEQIAASAMGAFANAIEAYISKGHGISSDKYAIEAARLINENIEAACKDAEKDKNLLKVHDNLLLGAHFSGVASLKAGFGFCHAIANALSGKYHLSTSLMNAILLPYVLKAYGDVAVDRLAKLADELEYPISEDTNLKAEWLIKRFETLCQTFELTNNLKEIIDPNEIQEIAGKAYAEATPLYPAPKMFDIAEVKGIINDARR